MTIRQYLVRRSGKYATRTFAFLIAAGVLVGMGPRAFFIRFVFAVLIMAVVVAAFVSFFHIPCPNCRKPLGRIGFWAANGGMRAGSACCPHCKLGLDEQIPQPSA